ncbi:MAG: ribonuclease T [Gammaproteobacteria bacterium]|nr:ribonuclease T [Gammaproteobacteria bacterium]
MADRFRGFLPVIIDVETAGFNHQKDALLEVAAVILRLNDEGILKKKESIAVHVEPFPGANLDTNALKFTGIDPFNPFRMAKPELKAMEMILNPIRKEVKATDCSRAILVGHNATFDLNFMQAAVARTKIKKNPFHQFSTFDTATLGGLAYGQSVLAKACKAAGIEFNDANAHAALYDAERTAELFCDIVNRWNKMAGFPEQF